VCKLACPRLAGQVSAWLAQWCSPQQIARRLRAGCGPSTQAIP
jgi:hypothetical protein